MAKSTITTSKSGGPAAADPAAILGTPKTAGEGIVVSAGFKAKSAQHKSGMVISGQKLQAIARAVGMAAEGVTVHFNADSVTVSPRAGGKPSAGEVFLKRRAKVQKRLAGAKKQHAHLPATPARQHAATASFKAAFTPDDRAQALLRGLEMREQMLTEAGGAFTLEDVQRLLYGVSRQAIDKRVRDGSLLAIPGPNGARRYPCLQFLADGSLLPGLKALQAALPSQGAWYVLHFLTAPHDALQGRSPIAALRAGNLDAVLTAAQGMGQQGS